MKVLLISANTERINMPTFPVGLTYVAAASRRMGHEARILDLLSEKNPDRRAADVIEAFGPEAIGISVRNIDDQCMETSRFLLDPVRDLIANCRKVSQAHLVLGGAGYSIYPESALEYLGADMGIQGEGEVAFTVLLDRLAQGAELSGVPGLYVRGKGLRGKRACVNDLDTLPLPDGDLLFPSYAENPDFWMPFQTRRGCPMKCSYCSTAAIEGVSLRKRSPERAVEGVERYVEAGFRQFYFTDNTFNIPPSYARELCRLLIAKNLGIAWRCIVYPSGIGESLVEKMAEAGCREVSLGSESGSEQMLRTLNKGFRPEDVRRSSELFAKYGINRLGFLLLGGPGETRDSVLESLAFADSLNLDALKVTVGIRIYPNTALAETAVHSGVISPEDDLLFPRFYVEENLKDWLYETVKSRISERPNWFM